MKQETRELSKLKLRAALEANRQLAIEEIQELPLATEQTKRYMVPLVCSRTGITMGSLATIAVAGHMPLLGQWKDTQILHPFFSMKPVALLQFARNSWLRFCALRPEEAADDAVVAKQEQHLRVITLCMLHNLTEVRQDIPWLPEFKDVVSNWTALMSICYWKAYLDSERFRFPQIRISKLERDVDLRSFLQLCFKCKKDYETNVNERAEEAKKKIAEQAMRGIIDDIAGKKPLSIKLLWRWFEANMPGRYKKDIDTWMWELFSATEKDITDFTIRDIELFEEIFLTECPTGSSISHAFLEVLRGKHALISQHFETYEILIPNSIAEQVASGEIAASGPMPELKDYPNKVAWMVAKAKWNLAQVDSRKHRDAAIERQRTETVTPSFRPKLVIGAQAEDLDELEADDGSDLLENAATGEEYESED